MSVPNQKKITINATKEKPFLSIGDKEWKEAYKQLTFTQFGVYLYLADNKQGYVLELSPTAIKEELNISPSSYHRAIDRLTELNYIYKEDGKLFFSPYPKKIRLIAKKKDNTIKEEIQPIQARNLTYSNMNREINNNKINRTNKQITKLGFKEKIINGVLRYVDDKGNVCKDILEIIGTLPEDDEE